MDLDTYGELEDLSDKFVDILSRMVLKRLKENRVSDRLSKLLEEARYIALAGDDEEEKLISN